MNDQIVIREIRNSDYDQLAEFNAAFPNETRTKNEWLDRYMIWWDLNPAYKPSHPRGVIALDGKKVFGTTNNFPSRMIWDGREQIVANGSTWRVLPEYRKYSMDIWDKHREMTSQFIIFNTSANPNVIRLLKLLRANEFIISNKWFYYFGSIKGLNKNPILRIIPFTHRMLLRLLPKSNNKFDIREGLPSKEEMNTLWDSCKFHYTFTNVRDYEFIKWLYATNKIFSIYSKNKFLGYFALHHDKYKNCTILSDFWPKEISQLCFELILEVIRKYPKTCTIIPSYCENIKHGSIKALLVPRRNCSIGYILSPERYIISKTNSFLTMLQGDKIF